MSYIALPEKGRKSLIPEDLKHQTSEVIASPDLSQLNGPIHLVFNETHLQSG